MKSAFFWRAFEETGDPLCYLFYKSFSETDEGGEPVKKVNMEKIPV